MKKTAIVILFLLALAAFAGCAAKPDAPYATQQIAGSAQGGAEENVSVSESANTDAGLVGEDAAKQTALSYVPGADASHITKFETGRDDGVPEYDIEIVYDGYEYDFEINAKDGSVLSRSKEYIGAAPSPAADIGQDKAIETALSYVSGADSSHVTSIKKEEDDGVLLYDVHILFDGFEYEFDITAADGKVIYRSKEPADVQEASSSSITIEVSPGPGTATPAPPAATSTPAPAAPAAAAAQQPSASDIGIDKARQIALSRVSGAADSDIYIVQDFDDGRIEYEGTIIYNGMEYDFEIDGATGNILDWDAEWFDYD